MIKYFLGKFPIPIVIIILALSSKTDRNDRIKRLEDEINNTDFIIENETKEKVNKLSKVVFFIENLASMFVYINGSTEYFNIVSDLPEKAEFTTNNAIKEFWFVN